MIKTIVVILVGFLIHIDAAFSQASMLSGCLETCTKKNYQDLAKCEGYCSCTSEKQVAKIRQGQSPALNDAEMQTCIGQEPTLRYLRARSAMKKPMFDGCMQTCDTPETGRARGVANPRQFCKFYCQCIADVGYFKQITGHRVTWNLEEQGACMKNAGWLDLKEQAVPSKPKEPINKEYLSYQARYLIIEKNFKGALEYIDKVLNEDPNYRRALNEKIYAYIGLGDKQQALAAYQDYKNRHPNSPYLGNLEKSLRENGINPAQ